MDTAAEPRASPDAEKNVYDGVNAEGHVEQLSNSQTYYSSPDVKSLSEEHRKYLLERHGTLELDPLPGYGDADPYNWSTRKVSSASSCRSRLTGIENHQSCPCGLPRHDVYIHSSLHPVGFRKHRHRFWSQSSKHNIFDVNPNRRLGSSTTVLAATIQTLWSTPRISFVSHLQRHRQHWMC